MEPNSSDETSWMRQCILASKTEDAPAHIMLTSHFITELSPEFYQRRCWYRRTVHSYSEAYLSPLTRSRKEIQRSLWQINSNLSNNKGLKTTYRLLKQWLKQWTYYLWYGCGTAVDADFIRGGNVLPTVTHCRDLGITIVSDLSSTQYISETPESKLHRAVIFIWWHTLPGPCFYCLSASNCWVQ